MKNGWLTTFPTEECKLYEKGSGCKPIQNVAGLGLALSARGGGQGRGRVRGQVGGLAGEEVVGPTKRAGQKVHRAGAGSALRSGHGGGQMKGQSEGTS